VTAPFTDVTTTRDLQVRARVSAGAERVLTRDRQHRISPQNVVAHFVQHGDEAWELRCVRVVGGIVRPLSGTVGVVTTPRVFWGCELGTAPQWLRDFVDQHRPQETER
jgi:hypothetical protein